MKYFSHSLNKALALGILAAPLTNATDNPFEVNDQRAVPEMPHDKSNFHIANALEREHSSPARQIPEGSCGNMIMDSEGMIMNANSDQLPRDCKEISEDIAITVRAGTRYSKKFNSTIFGFDEHEWTVEPCSRLTVTFINEDEVRHQWMVHNLPSYLYPQGMFHLEVNGGFQKTGTFIVPSGNQTYLVHCDLSQHMEKGMKGQLKVGKGNKDLPGIPGITNVRFPNRY